MQPLNGIRVVDFGAHMSGAICSLLLADFGAEVTKVEPPNGESNRRWGHARYGEKQDISSTFAAINRNKSSISIDLKKPEGLALAKKLIMQADVVFENMKPGVMDRLGLGYEAVSKMKPEIVYCSISGFGRTGPLAPRPGFDNLMQCYAGHLSVTGEPGRPSSRIGPSTIDVLTGTHGAFAIMVALHERQSSGLGQHVDTSLYESAIQMVTHMIADYTGTGVLSGKYGPYFPFFAPYGVFMAQDREFYLGASSDPMWKKMATAMGRQDILEDARFLTNSDRAKNQRQLYDILEPVFREKPAQHWMDMALAQGVPVSLCHDISEVVKQPQALAREAVVPVPGFDSLRSAGIPIKFSRTPGKIHKAPPTLGEDTDRILRDMGLSEKDIGYLREVRIIR